MYKELIKFEFEKKINESIINGILIQTKFLKEESQIALKYLKKFSTSLSTKEIKIKTTLRFFVKPIREAKINNIYDSYFLPIVGRALNLYSNY